MNVFLCRPDVLVDGHGPEDNIEHDADHDEDDFANGVDPGCLLHVLRVGLLLLVLGLAAVVVDAVPPNVVDLVVLGGRRENHRDALDLTDQALAGIQGLGLELGHRVRQISVESHRQSEHVEREHQPPVDHLVVGCLGQILNITKHDFQGQGCLICLLTAFIAPIMVAITNMVVKVTLIRGGKLSTSK